MSVRTDLCPAGLEWQENPGAGVLRDAIDDGYAKVIGIPCVLQTDESEAPAGPPWRP